MKKTVVLMAAMMMIGGMAFAQEPAKSDVPEKTEQPAPKPEEEKKDEPVKPDAESKCGEKVESGSTCSESAK